MSYDLLEQKSPPNQASQADLQRLYIADKTLAILEAELAKLECNGDDLTYLMEVLRHGIRQAIGNLDDDPALYVSSQDNSHTH